MLFIRIAQATAAVLLAATAASPVAAQSVTTTANVAIDEDGGLAAGAIDVVLATQPTTAVTVSAQSADTAVTDIQPADDAVTFTPVNWSTTQQIPLDAVDDDVDNAADRTAQVDFSVTALDVNYNGLATTPSTVTLTDNDVANLVGPATTLAVGENAGVITSAIQLASEPATDVTVTATSNDVAVVTTTTALTFAPGDWNTDQTLTLTGVDNLVDALNDATATVSLAVTSTDALYNAVAPADTTVTAIDDDTQFGGTTDMVTAFTVNEGNGVTPETHDIVFFLNTDPVNPVTISAVSSSAAATVSGPLEFIQGNFASAQTFTVSTVPDDIQDGDELGLTIDFTFSTTNAAPYMNVEAPSAPMQIDDDDVANVVLVSATATVAENSVVADYVLDLDSEPTAPVVVTVTSADASTAVPSNIGTDDVVTFDSSNWSNPGTVKVESVPDNLETPADRTADLTFAITSADALYNDLADIPGTLQATDLDTSTGDVTSTHAAHFTLAENAGSQIVTMQLDTDPVAGEVVVAATPSDAAITVTNPSLTFNSGNYNTDQTLTIDAVADNIDLGASTIYSVSYAPLTNGAQYTLVIPDTTITVTDDDIAGIPAASDLSPTIPEAAGSVTVTMVLDTEPISSVTISAISGDVTIGTVTPSSLVFTNGDYAAPHTLTLDSVANDVDSVAQPTVQFTLSTTSDDGLYAAITPTAITLEVTDDDTAAFDVSAMAVSVNEEAGERTVTFNLATEPLDFVTIGLVSQNGVVATSSPASMIFSAADWNVPQTLTVTGTGNLQDVDPEATTTVQVTVTTNEVQYTTLPSPFDITVTVIDNDVAGIETSSLDVTIAEANVQSEIQFRLTSEPTDVVTASFTSADAGTATVTVTPIEFTAAPGDWSTIRTFTVTSVDNTVDAGGDATVRIDVDLTSDDPKYQGINAYGTFTITDDDTSTGQASGTYASSQTISETAADTATFTLAFTTLPDAAITVAVTTPGSFTTLSAASLEFSTGNYNIEQTVTVTSVDDDIAYEVDQVAVISYAVSTTATDYVNLGLADGSVTVTDDDTGGVGFAAVPSFALGLTVEEDGDPDGTLVFHLDSQPLSSVTFDFAIADTGVAAMVGATSLTFAPGVWNTDQTVSVEGVDDGKDSEDRVTQLQITATSDDSSYNGAINVPVEVTDDEVDAGRVLGTLSDAVTVAEGLSVEVTVDLGTAIGGGDDMTITATPPAGTDINPTSLTFDDGNWNTLSTFTVTGVENEVDFPGANDPVYHISYTVTGTSAVYNTLYVNPLSLTVTDNDVAALVANPASLMTILEASDVGTFAIDLGSEPTSAVTVSVASSDYGFGSVSVSSVTFSMANWSDEQTVSVTSIPDLINYQTTPEININLVISTDDGLYASLPASAVTVEITDDDVKGSLLDPTSITVAEASATDTAAVRLTSEPREDVTVTVSPSTADLLTSPVDLTFTTSNWMTEQTVTATGVPNDIDHPADVVSAVDLTITTNSDEYAALGALASVAVTVANDDTASITQGALAVAVSEAAGQDTTTFVLDTVPTVDVTISGSSADTAIATVSADLTFTPANYNSVQAMTVTGVQNDIDHTADETVAISFTVTTADAGFTAMPALTDLVVTVNNDDVAAFSIPELTGTVDDENLGEETLEIMLATEPVENVTVDVTSDANLVVTPAMLIFTSGDWNTAQTITATGVDNIIDHGDDTPGQITVATRTNEVEYAAVADAVLTMTIVDDDTAGATADSLLVTVTEAVGPTQEDTAVYTLDTVPTADVVVTFTSADAAIATTTSVLTFTSGNYNAPQTATITGVDNAVDTTQDQTVAVDLSFASADTVFAAASSPSLTVTLTDDDTSTGQPTVGSTFSNAVTIAEAAAEATFTLALTDDPLDTVTVDVAPSSAIVTLSTASLTFGSGDFAVEQTVTATAVDDDIDRDMNRDVMIDYTLSSGSGLYSSLVLTSATITVTEDDIASVNDPAVPSASIPENSGELETSFVLSSEPLDDVTVTAVSSAPAVAVINPANVIFSTTTWSTAQTFTATAVPNTIQHTADETTQIDFAVLTAGDALYAGLGPITPQTITVADDDVAGVTFSTTDISVAEAAGEADITLVLDTEPADDITITVASADVAIAVATPAEVTFTNVNWNVPQTITATGIAEFVDHPADRTVAVNYAVVTASDVTYSGIGVPTPATVTVTDDDTAGLARTAVAFTVAEAAGEDTFGIELDSEPLNPVTVTLTSARPAEVTTSAALTFSVANWSDEQTFTVTAVDDATDESADETTLVSTAVTSLDTVYNGFAVADVSVQVTDDDTSAGQPVGTFGDGQTVGETGGQALFTLSLDIDPTQDVFVDVTSSDVGLATLVGGPTVSLTFTSGTFAAVQTVTMNAVGNVIDELNDNTVSIDYALTTTSASYNTLVLSSATVELTDDDNAGLQAGFFDDVTIAETAGSATVALELSSEPTLAVTIAATSSDTTLAAVVDAAFTFDDTDWNTAQTLTFTAVENDIDHAVDPTPATISLAWMTTDPTYSTLGAITSSTVSITDNDVAAVVLSVPTVSIADEANTVEIVTVNLDSEPVQDVTVAVSLSDPAVASLSVPDLTFTTLNWANTQQLSITSLPNDVDTVADEETLLQFALSSTDTVYAAVTVTDVTVTVLDDDTAGIADPAPTTLLLGEATAEDTFSIVLQSEPVQPVTIAIANSDGAATSTSTSLLEFPIASWSVAQTVTVTATENSVDHPANLVSTLSFTVSTPDGKYQTPPLPDLADVVVTVTDNDVADLVVSTTTLTHSTENAEVQEFEIELATEPLSLVTVTVSSADTAIADIALPELVFSAGTWNTAQTVSVTSQNNDIDHAVDETVEIQFVLTSPDTQYHLLVEPAVTATSADDDAAGVTAPEPTAPTVAEAAGLATATFVLDSEPLSQVTIDVASVDTAIVTVSAASLEFDDTTWNVVQTVTMTAVENDIAHPADETVQVTFGLRSDDAVYTALPALTSVTVEVTNNDVPAITTSSSTTTSLENLGTSEITVELATEPLADVTIDMLSLDTAIAVISDAQFIFDNSNWNTAATLTVTGQNNNIDHDVDLTVQVTYAISSGDSEYVPVTEPDLIVTITDDDTAATVTNLSPVVDEAAAVVEVDFTLGTEPTADVAVAFASADTGIATVGPATLTFTSANYFTAQTFSVTGVANAIDHNPDQTVSIDFTLTSTDPEYNALVAPSSTVTVTDDDTASITGPSVTDATLMENSEQVVTEIVLTTEPIADVTIQVTSASTAIATVSEAALTFTSGDYNTAQTVTITAVPNEIDHVVDETTTIDFAILSTDGPYAAHAVPASVTIEVTDDDTSDVTGPFPTAIAASETNGEETVTFVLDAEPVLDVVIQATSLATGVATVSADLTFTSADWNVEQTFTVTGVPNVIDHDVDETAQIDFVVSTSDTQFGTVGPLASTTFTSNDDDTAVITGPSTTAFSVIELNGEDTASFVLATEPIADVTITGTSADTGIAIVTPTEIVFTSGDWNVAQTFTATAVPNVIDHAVDETVQIDFVTVTTDVPYDALVPTPTTVTVTNDDVALVNSATTTITVNEIGAGEETFGFTLDTEPEVPVTITVTSGDVSLATVSANSPVTFSTTNWNVEQTITVTAVDDFLDPAIDETVVFTSVVTSSDNYGGAPIVDVTLTIVDDDEPPSDPAIPTCEPSTTSSVSISWLAPADNGDPISQYEIDRDAVADGTAVTEAYTSSGLVVATSYLMRVRASNMVGTSNWSPAANCTTLSDIPDAPVTACGTTDANNIEVTWVEPADNGEAITEYIVERSGDFVETISAPVELFVFEELLAVSDYVTRVRAVNSLGEGPWSANLTCSTTTGPPLDVEISCGATTVTTQTINWAEPGDQGSAITSYEISNSTGNMGTTDAATRTWTSDELDFGTSYTFRVTASNAVGTSNVVSKTCITAFPCGDRLVNGTETCDDGNKVNGDGCSSLCAIESGFKCDGMSPSSCAGCGDGKIDAPELTLEDAVVEECDDGGRVDGDGCTAECVIEDGWTCLQTGTGGSTRCHVCGDGKLEPDETCDDGNVEGADGCSAKCAVEPAFSCAVNGTAPSACEACTFGTCARLTSLRSGHGTFSPSFSPATTTYVLTLDRESENVTISVLPVVQTGEMSVSFSGATSVEQDDETGMYMILVDAIPVNAVGVNLAVSIQSPDAATTTVYRINVIRAAADNAELRKLPIDLVSGPDGSVLSVDDSNIVSVTAGVTEVTFDLETVDPLASVSVEVNSYTLPTVAADGSKVVTDLGSGGGLLVVAAPTTKEARVTVTVTVFAEDPDVTNVIVFNLLTAPPVLYASLGLLACNADKLTLQGVNFGTDPTALSIVLSRSYKATIDSVTDSAIVASITRTGGSNVCNGNLRAKVSTAGVAAADRAMVIVATLVGAPSLVQPSGINVIPRFEQVGYNYPIRIVGRFPDDPRRLSGLEFEYRLNDEVPASPTDWFKPYDWALADKTAAILIVTGSPEGSGCVEARVRGYGSPFSAWTRIGRVQGVTKADASGKAKIGFMAEASVVGRPRGTSADALSICVESKNKEMRASFSADCEACVDVRKRAFLDGLLTTEADREKQLLQYTDPNGNLVLSYFAEVDDFGRANGLDSEDAAEWLRLLFIDPNSAINEVFNVQAVDVSVPQPFTIPPASELVPVENVIADYGSDEETWQAYLASGGTALDGAYAGWEEDDTIIPTEDESLSGGVGTSVTAGRASALTAACGGGCPENQACVGGSCVPKVAGASQVAFVQVDDGDAGEKTEDEKTIVDWLLEPYILGAAGGLLLIIIIIIICCCKKKGKKGDGEYKPSKKDFQLTEDDRNYFYDIRPDGTKDVHRADFVKVEKPFTVDAEAFAAGSLFDEFADLDAMLPERRASRPAADMSNAHAAAAATAAAKYNSADDEVSYNNEEYYEGEDDESHKKKEEDVFGGWLG